jgi:hypothetical protein
MENKNIHKELEELSPLLAKMKRKEQSIKMPDNYFHYLENSVMQQVQLEKTPVASKLKEDASSFWASFFLRSKFLALGSIALLILAVIYFVQIGADNSQESLQFAELTDTEILNYLADNAETLDIYSLSEFEEEASVLDMIDISEDDVDYFFEDNSNDILREDLF